VLGAECLEYDRRLGQGMTRNGRPNVVLNLVVEPARKPIIEKAGCYIASGARLQADKMGGVVLLRGEDLHRVVADCEHDTDEETAQALGVEKTRTFPAEEKREISAMNARWWMTRPVISAAYMTSEVTFLLRGSIWYRTDWMSQERRAMQRIGQ
jgi:hypothetical protein